MTPRTELLTRGVLAFSFVVEHPCARIPYYHSQGSKFSPICCALCCCREGPPRWLFSYTQDTSNLHTKTVAVCSIFCLGMGCIYSHLLPFEPAYIIVVGHPCAHAVTTLRAFSCYPLLVYVVAEETYASYTVCAYHARQTPTLQIQR